MGVFADYYSGGGSGHVSTLKVITPLEGIMQRAALANITVLFTPDQNPVKAREVALKADAVIVVGATTASEGADRASLSLDWGTEELLAGFQGIALLKPTVLLMQTPGAVLTPWRFSCAAVANLFLAGEET